MVCVVYFGIVYLAKYLKVFNSNTTALELNFSLMVILTK